MGLFACAFFLALQFRVSAAKYSIESWDSDRGLPDNFVTSMVQTPDGYLWIGTYGGLVRFDGARFVTFRPADTPELGNRRILKLFLDDQGSLWINTYDGSLTSLRNGIFKREWDGTHRNVSEASLVAATSREIIFAFHSGLLIRRPAAPGKSNAWQILMPPGNPRSAYYCQDGAGTLWCYTSESNLWRVSDGRYDATPKDAGLRGAQIRWVEPDLSGHIWVGTDKELALWNGSHFQNMTPDGESDMNVASFLFTRDGGMLISANGRLRKYLNRKWIAEYNAWPDLMDEQQLQPTLHEDREGGFWRTSPNLGLIHIDPKGGSQDIATADGLPANHITCWLEDQDGNYWVGLENAGLARLRESHFETLAIPGQPARPAMSVCEDKNGALWVATYGNGLICLQNGKLTDYQISASRRNKNLFSIYPDSHGFLWVSAGMEDLYAFQGGLLKPGQLALGAGNGTPIPKSVVSGTSSLNPLHSIKSILVDTQGRLWLGTKAGLERWANGTLRVWNNRNGSEEAAARALVEDKAGVIWVGTDDGNLYRVDGDTLRSIPLPASSAHQSILALLADAADGSLWIGTADSGLLHYHAGQFTCFTSYDGLPDDLICQILDDQKGNLWLGTHHGICRVSKLALSAFANGDAPSIARATYGRRDGLPTLQCSEMYQPSAWRGHDGRLWFATARGVVGVQPDEVPVNLRPPPVAIDEVQLDGIGQTLTEGTTSKDPGTTLLKVSPGKNNFGFRYTALSLTNPHKVYFRYKLDGVDSNWVDAGTRRWTQYTYLKPGTYRFHVIACNEEGVWNQIGASITLQVLPHYWETWWFLTLSGLAVFAGVVTIVRYTSHREWRRQMAQIERQRDIEQDRTRIARDIHDHIGSGLTRINLLNELLLGDPVHQLPNRVEQITVVTCELMSAMDEIVWALNPKDDTLDSLMSYLCGFAEEYLREANIRLRIDIPTQLPIWPLTSEIRHNIFLAAKESFNNIVKHSRAAEVSLSLKIERGFATLEICDNGRGFQLDFALRDISMGNHAPQGDGLENLRKRASSIGGRFVIDSKPGIGTRIQLTIPQPALERTPAHKFNQVHP